MKQEQFNIVRFDADEGKVFDWKNLEEHLVEDEETHEVTQEHLYAKTIFIGGIDSIDNYVEVDEPLKEE
jgi:hypothetical protein